MGACIPKKTNKSAVIHLNLQQISRYPRTSKLVIRIKNSQGKIIGNKNLLIHLTDPIKRSVKPIELPNLKSLVSFCVLPGQDPRAETQKPCQDNCKIFQLESSILLALFDGHGTDGDKVSNFCSNFIESYYRQHFSSRSSDISKFLIELAEECDKELRLQNFDILYSGTTCVVVVLFEGVIYSASVGDSRALLGTTNPPTFPLAPLSLPSQDRELLEEVKVHRFSQSNPSIKGVQLTKDQKPEDPEELQRILAAGGRVQRLLDEAGNRVGPYRVWETDSNAPGLAMSRSLGDAIGKQIGVISTPVCTKHIIDKENDFFVVIASDGLWDVMDNEDVANFVESFRRTCKSGNLRHSSGDIVPANTCIAHLLCEEARMRWFTIVEDEDVMIDDICCVVIELKKSEFAMNFVPNLGSVEMDPEKIISVGGRETKMKEVLTRDPRRGSQVFDKGMFDKLTK